VDPQDLGDLCRRLAGVPGDLHPSVPERLLTIRGGRVVADLVAPLGLDRVRQPTVQLDHHTVVTIEAIAASAPAVRALEWRLPDRLGEPVRALHVAAVAVLQHRMVAAGRRRDEFMQFSTPAQPGALTHRRAQPRRVGQVPRECAGHPPADVIEGRRRLGQVEHGLLHRRQRRVAGPQHDLAGARAAVQADPADHLDPALPGNRHVNRVGRLVGEPLELGRGLVAQDRARPGPEEGRPQLCTVARRSGEGQVDAAMNRSPPAASQPELDHVRGQSGPEGLRAGHNSLLLPGKVAQRRRKLTIHAESVTTPTDKTGAQRQIREDLGFRVRFGHYGPHFAPVGLNHPRCVGPMRVKRSARLARQRDLPLVEPAAGPCRWRGKRSPSTSARPGGSGAQASAQPGRWPSVSTAPQSGQT
jgi:hypothetical protein